MTVFAFEGLGYKFCCSSLMNGIERLLVVVTDTLLLSELGEARTIIF